MAAIGVELCKDVPKESRSWLIATFGIVLLPLAILAVALRFYSRISITKELGLDDWLMLAGAIMTVIIIGINTQSELAGSHV